MKILIHAYSRKLKVNMENPKNYPYWPQLVDMLCTSYDLCQIGVRGDNKLLQFKKEIFFDLPFKEIVRLVKECDAWISIDSFLPHLGGYLQKPGLVIWGPSDPSIFGHACNINIFKSVKYFRPDQFGTWEDAKYTRDAYHPAEFVYAEFRKHFPPN